jgi:hypothetical protein
MPESVSGPIDALREEAGLESMRPLFVSADRAPKPRTMMLAAARSALETSATDAPRETLRGTFGACRYS